MEEAMLSVSENEQLTRVGPGTPMGDLIRQYSRGEERCPLKKTAAYGLAKRLLRVEPCNLAAGNQALAFFKACFSWLAASCLAAATEELSASAGRSRSRHTVD
jgi:hypothetical protein